jgi:CRP-like cAMP-binding protein
MVALHSLRPHPKTYFTSEPKKRAACAPHTPRQNHLLAALPPEDLERLLPDLKPVPLPLGWNIYGARDQTKYVYFLAEGIVCRVYTMESGASTETGVTGREGVVGIPSFLGGGTMPGEDVVLVTGYAYRLSEQLLRDEFNRGGPMHHLLLRYTQTLMTQIAQTVVCNRHHSLEQQFCRWLLICLDRLPSRELIMTQELIGNMLGVRREGITEAAGNLQNAGLIEYHRGHINVLDRPGLEARVCECYAVVKKECGRLLPVTPWGNRIYGLHPICKERLKSTCTV